jgi:hypothetical protein
MPYSTYSFLIVYTFIYMCIHGLGHLSPCPAPYLPSLTGRTCSAFLFSNFVEEKTRDNKKDIVFLLVWDKDSYTKRFLALLPCTCILQLALVHLYQTSSLLPRPLPKVASASLRIHYLLLYSGHINYFQVFGFLPFSYSSCMCSPLSVWPMSNNISAFVLICIWGRTYDFWSSEPG